MAIFVRYGQISDEAYLLRRLGEEDCQKGRTKEGLALLEGALKIYSDSADMGYYARVTQTLIRRFQKT